MFRSISEDIKSVFNSGTRVNILILCNVIIFVVLLLLKVFLAFDPSLFSSVFDQVSMPGNISRLIYKPWTIVTYMFTHIGFWHILWNMIALNMFGNIVGDLLGDKRILPTYLLGGLGGAVLFLLWINIVGIGGSSIHGASAAVMALAGVAAAVAPDYNIRLLLIGNVRLKYIVLVFILLDLTSFAAQSNMGGVMSHMGGLLTGFGIVALMKSGRDITESTANFFESFRNIFQPSKRTRRDYNPKMKVEYRSKNFAEENRRDDKRFKGSIVADDAEEELNKILDKIKITGYDKLTNAEKNFLNKMSNK
jgi:membrane associated rhomboid family serine protease